MWIWAICRFEHENEHEHEIDWHSSVWLSVLLKEKLEG